jgi:hypothetical protein
MDITAVAFLVLLGGTSAEHVIPMPSMEDCHRAAETIASYECLTADEFDNRVRTVGNSQTDLQPASGDPVAMPTGTPEIKPLEGTPSALKRQVRRALTPEPSSHPVYPAKRGVNEQGNARLTVADNR